MVTKIRKDEAIVAEVVRNVYENYDPAEQKYTLNWQRLKAFAKRYQLGVPLVARSSNNGEYEINRARQILESFCKKDPELKKELEQRESEYEK